VSSWACPTCGDWWGTFPRDVVRRPETARQCPDCARAQAQWDDERADVRAEYGL
jgi:hypothetical protein